MVASLPSMMSPTMHMTPVPMTSMSSIMNRPPTRPNDDHNVDEQPPIVVAMDDPDADTIPGTAKPTANAATHKMNTEKAPKGDANGVAVSSWMMTVCMCLVARIMV